MRCFRHGQTQHYRPLLYCWCAFSAERVRNGAAHWANKESPSSVVCVCAMGNIKIVSPNWHWNLAWMSWKRSSRKVIGRGKKFNRIGKGVGRLVKHTIRTHWCYSPQVEPFEFIYLTSKCRTIWWQLTDHFCSMNMAFVCVHTLFCSFSLQHPFTWHSARFFVAERCWNENVALDIVCVEETGSLHHRNQPIHTIWIVLVHFFCKRVMLVLESKMGTLLGFFCIPWTLIHGRCVFYFNKPSGAIRYGANVLFTMHSNNGAQEKLLQIILWGYVPSI